MSLLGLLIVGLLAGAVARLLVPGRDPMGWLGTLVLGLGGSIVGGFLARVLLGDKSIGLFGSVVGAVIVLLVYNAWSRRQRVS